MPKLFWRGCGERICPAFRFTQFSGRRALLALPAKRIPGIQINVLDREVLQSTRVGLEIASALYELHPDRIDLDRVVRLIGDSETIEAIKAGRKAVSLWVDWQKQRAEFVAFRARYLLY